ncbi:hypothetical protein [Parvularcula lutaonensis]|uniref:Transmembrane protein (PGPGW) n=1 Tax=Parvularcula lutaonensis TaxID=491923 RepID=A0ABV7MDA0_9PROT|nr:hypothetical protein [Parvularcula lutaonensis]GGY40101.1 hypothetical protein GCM10007148_05700 [Parvularcula lutaonensis]
MIWRMIGTIVGLVLLVVSIPLTISPIPLGLLLLFISIIILVASNPLAARFLRWLRRKDPRVDSFFRNAEEVLPEELSAPLHETDGEDDREDETATTQRALGEPMRRVDIPRRLR